MKNFSKGTLMGIATGILIVAIAVFGGQALTGGSLFSNPSISAQQERDKEDSPKQGDEAAGATNNSDQKESSSVREKNQEERNQGNNKGNGTIQKDGEYSSKDEVAQYLFTYGELPSNYITKREAQDLGWKSDKGNLWDVAPGMSIGGDRFGNREKKLPDKKNRKWYECDIDYKGGYRGEKRIVFSDDGLVFYTGNHYKSFTELYPK